VGHNKNAKAPVNPVNRFFGINNWADARKNEQYLVSLSHDLRVDSLALVKHERGLEEMKKVINGLWSLTYKKDLTKADTVAGTIAKLGAVGFFTPEDYTYRALQQTSNFSLLSAYNWRWLSCMIPTRNYNCRKTSTKNDSARLRGTLQF
jgi:hypothetical protein